MRNWPSSIRRTARFGPNLLRPYLQQRELALFLVPLTRTEQGTKICWPKLKDRYMESQRYSQIQIHHKDCSHGAEIKLFDCRSCISCHGTIATLLPCPHVRMSSVFLAAVSRFYTFILHTLRLPFAPGSFVLICLAHLRLPVDSWFCLRGLCGDSQFGLSLICVAMYSRHLVTYHLRLGVFIPQLTIQDCWSFSAPTFPRLRAAQHEIPEQKRVSNTTQVESQPYGSLRKRNAILLLTAGHTELRTWEPGSLVDSLPRGPEDQVLKEISLQCSCISLYIYIYKYIRVYMTYVYIYMYTELLPSNPPKNEGKNTKIPRSSMPRKLCSWASSVKARDSSSVWPWKEPLSVEYL